MTVAVGRYTEPGPGSVNTFWIETATSVIVIDGQRELSKARKALGAIERTGKPVIAIFVTHPHPDHFGGVGVFTEGRDGVPIFASRQTRESIASDRFGLVKASREAVKDDFPPVPTLPDHDIEDGKELVLDGIRIVVHELGPSEAECMTALHLPDEGLLFAADAIQDQATAYLLEGRTAAWIDQLHALKRRFPHVSTVYPGHGEPGALNDLVDRQLEYLTFFRAQVAAEAQATEWSEASAERVASAVEQRYPGYLPVAAIPELLKMDATPVAQELGVATDNYH